MGTTRLLALFVLLVALSLVGCTLPSTPPAQQSTAAALASTSTTQPAPASTTTMPQPSPTTMPAPTFASPPATPATGYASPVATPAPGYASSPATPAIGYAGPRATPGLTGSTPLATPLSTAGASPLATPSASSAPGVYSPISQTQCNGLKDLVTQTLGRPAAAAQAPFRDPVSGAGGTGCEITVTGTGKDFANFRAVMDALKVPLKGLGWTEDPAGQADGPTGTATVLRQGNTVALVGVHWQPSPDANCPQDRPISACPLQPEQQLYTITVNVAQRAAP